MHYFRTFYEVKNKKNEFSQRVLLSTYTIMRVTIMFVAIFCIRKYEFQVEKGQKLKIAKKNFIFNNKFSSNRVLPT